MLTHMITCSFSSIIFGAYIIFLFQFWRRKQKEKLLKWKQNGSNPSHCISFPAFTNHALIQQQCLRGVAIMA